MCAAESYIIREMEQLTDEELVYAYRDHGRSPNGDPWLNELFRRYHARVGLWCFRFTGDRDSGADLAQEIFLKAFRNLDSFRGDAKFGTWLYAITRNHCFNALKARTFRPAEYGDEMLSGIADLTAAPDVALFRESSARTLREVLNASALDETETQVMRLHYGEDVPLETITRLLKLQNTSGAKAYIVSAKRKLSRAVQRWKARGARLA